MADEAASADIVIAYLPEASMGTALELIRAWGDTKKGIVKAILLSSILFGMLHLLNAIANPFGMVLFQAVIVSLPGILYAA